MTVYNIGTGQAYATFTALVAGINLAAGDIVDGSANGSTPFREQWVPDGNGENGNPIIIRNATIAGADLVTGFSGPDGNGEYTKAGFSTTINVLLKNGRRLSKGTIGALTGTEWGYNAGTLYLGFDPTDHTIEAGQRISCIDVNDKDYITFQNLILYGGNNRTDADEAGSGLVIRAGSTNIIATNLTVYGCYYSGIDMADADDILIQHSTIHDCMSAGVRIEDGSTGISVSHVHVYNIANLASDSGAGGDPAGIEVAGATAQVDTVTISDCEVHDGGFGITGAFKPDAGIPVYEGINVTVTRNKVYGWAGPGIYFTAIAQDTGGAAAYNVIYHNGRTTSANAVVTGIRVNTNAGMTNEVDIYNNVLYKNTCAVVGGTSEIGHIHIGARSTANVKNNISHTPVGTYAYHVNASTTDTVLAFSNNDYWWPSSDRWMYGGVAKATLAAWVSASSETNGKNVDPLFIHLDENGFRLGIDSLCIDAGADLSLDYDLEGNAVQASPSIGAFEHINRHRYG